MDNIIEIYYETSNQTQQLDYMILIYQQQENYLRYIYFGILFLMSYIFYLQQTLKYNNKLNDKTLKVNDRLVTINNKYKKMIQKINVISNNEESRISKKVCLIKNVLLFNKI